MIVRVNEVLNRTVVVDVLTTCAVVIFRVKKKVLFRTTFTWTIKLNLLLRLLMGSSLSR